MKKVLLSAFAVCMFTGAAFASVGHEKGKKDEKKENSLKKNEVSKLDDATITCHGTFSFVDQKTHLVVAVHEEINSDATIEDDCFSWITKRTLQLVDANPQWDIIGTGGLNNDE